MNYTEQKIKEYFEEGKENAAAMQLYKSCLQATEDGDLHRLMYLIWGDPNEVRGTSEEFRNMAKDTCEYLGNHFNW